MRPYVYCPRCRGALAEGALCPACGLTFDARPATAVAMAALEGERIVLVKRRWEPMADHWALPAGFIERAEDPRRTVCREVFEETGLRVRPTGLLGAYPAGGPAGRVILLVYRGLVEGGSLQAGDDAAEAGFFALTELPTPLAFGPHRLVLQWLQRKWPDLERGPSR